MSDVAEDSSFRIDRDTLRRSHAGGEDGRVRPAPEPFDILATWPIR